MKSYKAKTSLKLILLYSLLICWFLLTGFGHLRCWLVSGWPPWEVSFVNKQIPCFSQSHKQWRAMPSALMQPQPISLTEFAANAATKWDPTTYDPVYSTSVRYNILGDLRRCVTKCARLRITKGFFWSGWNVMKFRCLVSSWSRNLKWFWCQ